LEGWKVGRLEVRRVQGLKVVRGLVSGVPGEKSLEVSDVE
jgi:hypothetical protein